MSDIDIEIDGKPFKAKANSMVIQVADEAGIYIPRFCYHKHLSIAANCRMCLVEVEKSPKALPACATPVMPGMKVFTRSPKALAAQKAVMEFLLINHPLDCPICDQGGECELQDLSMGFGSADSNYVEGKRSVKDEDIGPLIATEMTRCIQCTRCVRFGDEVAGMRELGAVGRGEHMEIGTYVGKSLQSEVSGNIIDLCPVGALTSKPFRFTARAWELNQFPSIAPHDCIGSNIYAHVRNGNVMRVVPRENVAINETWIADRDRFSYEGLYHADRLEKPMIRVNNHWQETDWLTALEFAVNGMRRVLESAGADEIGALASPNSTLEEFYLLQKLLRSLGSSNIDHRLHQVDFTDQDDMPVFPGLNTSIADIENCDVIFLIGSNIRKEQPSAALRIRKAVRQGARVIVLNMMDYQFNFDLAAKKIVAPHQFVQALAGVTKALVGDQAELSKIVLTEADQAIAKIIREGKKVGVFLGAEAFNHPNASHIRALASWLAKENNAVCGFLTQGANAAGAWLAGAVPHRKAAGDAAENIGFDAQSMLLNPRKAYLLLNVEPDLDFANPIAAQSALEHAEFVVALSTFANPVLEQQADVLLPVAPFTETSGTFVNAAGEWQSFKGVTAAFGESRPAWKVLRVLGNLFECPGFEYESSEAVKHEVRQAFSSQQLLMSFYFASEVAHIQPANDEQITRVGMMPIYATDNLVRRASALQAAQSVIEGDVACVRLNPRTASALNVQEMDIVTVKQRDYRVRLPAMLDERVPERAACIASGILATSSLSELFGPIEIQKV